MKKPALVQAEQGMSTEELASKLKEKGIRLFRDHSGFPLNQAQRNLEGLTPYADDKTLAYFKAKILTVHVMDDGLILGLVESLQAGFNQEDGRVYRPVFFDVFGNVAYSPKIDASFKTSKQANAEFWKQADKLDAVSITIEGIKTKQGQLTKELDSYSSLLEELEAEHKA